jgi:hypothetical protein
MVPRIVLFVAVAVACASDARSPIAPPEPTPAPPEIAPASRDEEPPADASVPDSLHDALAELRAQGFDAAAEVIARRVAQRQAKMRLSLERGRAAAVALLAVADREEMRALHAVMPRSTVELARAVRERALTIEAAARIARYLVRVVGALGFERLAVFDENHSHVTGRAWHEIDYSGERMTWKAQRDYWSPRGVASFATAESIHAYFVGAERLPHWQRVYRPRGSMADVAAP